MIVMYRSTEVIKNTIVNKQDKSYLSTWLNKMISATLIAVSYSCIKMLQLFRDRLQISLLMLSQFNRINLNLHLT